MALKLKNRLGELMAEYSRKTGRRLTQMDLSEATGVAQATISNYENNKIGRYDASVVARFLEFFEVSAGEFFIAVVEDESGQYAPALAG